MGQTVLIARREMTEMVRDGRFRWPVAGLLCLTLVSFLAGWQDYRSRKLQYEAIEKSERERWLAQRARSPHTAVHQGMYIFRPQLLLSAVDRGIEPYVGMATHAEESQNLFKWKPAEDTRTLRRFGEITAASTLQIVIPLVIVLLVFPVFVTERENGTLRLTLALGVRQTQFVRGKLLGVLMPLAIAIVPATALGAAALFYSSDAARWPGSAQRLLWMIVAYVAYFGIVVGACVTVSARARSSRLALVTLLALWFATTVLAPQAATELTEAMVPTPSGPELIAAINRDKAKGEGRDDGIEGIERQLLLQYHVRTLAELPVSPVGIAMQRGEEVSARISNRHFERLYGGYERQTAFLQLFGFVSPLIALQTVSMGLAGTDPPAQADIARSAERYRQQLVRIMNEDITRNRNPALPVTTLADDFPRGRDVWERVPPYHYELPPASAIVARYGIGLSGLAFWLAASIAIAAFAVRRVQVD